VYQFDGYIELGGADHEVGVGGGADRVTDDEEGDVDAGVGGGEVDLVGVVFDEGSVSDGDWFLVEFF